MNSEGGADHGDQDGDATPMANWAIRHPGHQAGHCRRPPASALPSELKADEMARLVRETGRRLPLPREDPLTRGLPLPEPEGKSLLASALQTWQLQ